MSSDWSWLFESWWAHAAEASLQFACFALVVALLDVLLARRAAPELRAALWLAVLAKLLLPSALLEGLRWSPPAAIVPTALQAAISADAESASAAVVPLAFAVWLAGVVLLASAGIARYRGLRRRRFAASEPAPRFVSQLALDVARKLGLARPAPVRVFRGSGGPVVLGCRHPIVLVPHSLLEAHRREQLELVLLHELAHVRRRDPLWSLLCLAVQVLYWFHPLVWFARRRLTLLRELSCDQTVGRALGGDTTRYRRTLLSLAWPQATGAPAGGLAFLTPRSQLVVRLRSLERPISKHSFLRRAQAALLFSLLFVCCLPRAPRLSVPFPFELPPMEELEGCLRLRYAVLAMTAHAETVEGSELAPLLSHSSRNAPTEVSQP